MYLELTTNSMCRYSLPMFLELFNKALETNPQGHAPTAERTRTLRERIDRLHQDTS